MENPKASNPPRAWVLLSSETSRSGPSSVSETQIISVLQRQERGEKARDICREKRIRFIGISEPTFYSWKSKYGGMGASDLRQLKDLQTENTKLKRMFADLSLVHEALKEAVVKKH